MSLSKKDIYKDIIKSVIGSGIGKAYMAAIIKKQVLAKVQEAVPLLLSH